MATHYTCDRCGEPSTWGGGAHTRGPVELSWPKGSRAPSKATDPTRELYLQATVSGSERDFGDATIDLCPNCIADALDEAASRLRTK